MGAESILQSPCAGTTSDVTARLQYKLSGVVCRYPQLCWRDRQQWYQSQLQSTSANVHAVRDNADQCDGADGDGASLGDDDSDGECGDWESVFGLDSDMSVGASGSDW